MYRQLRLRFSGLRLPMMKLTAEHADMRIIAYGQAREGNLPIPLDNIYLVRAPVARHDAVRQMLESAFEEYEEIATVEPHLFACRAHYKLGEQDPLRAFLGVLADAVGTILAFDPVTIVGGVMELPLLVVPRGDTTLKLRALQQYAAEQSIDFTVLEDLPVPTLSIQRPRQGILDLLEWQVLQALDSAGLYGAEALDEDTLKETIAALADEFGLDVAEVEKLRLGAERRVVHEYARTRSANLGHATAPRPGQE